MLAVLALALNALVWGLSWWPLRQLNAEGLHPLWATAAVFALATLVLIFISPQGWRHFKQHPQLWWLMAASGLTNIGFNWAVTTGDVVRVVLLFYLMPTWSLLLAWWMLGEHPTRGALMRLSLALVGVLLVLKTPESSWPLPQDLSDVLALLAGFSFALTNIWLLRLQHTPESSRMLAMFGGGALMASACAAVATLTGVIPAVFAAPLDGLDVSTIGAWAPYVLGLSAAFLVSNIDDTSLRMSLDAFGLTSSTWISIFASYTGLATSAYSAASKVSAAAMPMTSQRLSTSTLR